MGHHNASYTAVLAGKDPFLKIGKKTKFFQILQGELIQKREVVIRNT